MTSDAPPIGRLLAPERVAICGSLSRETGLGHRTLRHLKDAGFAGEVVTARSAADLGADVDVAIVAVPATAAPDVVADLDGRAAYVIVYTSGFEEAGGAALPVPSRGTRLIGPNAVGLYYAPARAVLTFAAAFDDMTGCEHGSGVVLLSQSGAFGARLVRAARRYGLHYDGFAGTGNETGAGACDLGTALVTDDAYRPRVLALYLESVRDGLALERMLAAAAEHGVRVALLPGGASAAGSAAARSHTAAISPDHAIVAELCAQYGAVTAGSDRELVETTIGMSLLGRTRGRRVGVVTGSGGAGVVAADVLTGGGLTVQPLGEPARCALAGPLPAYASTANPVDVTAQVIGDTPVLASTVRTLADSGEVDAVLAVGRVEQAASVRDAGAPDVPVVTAILDGDAATVRDAVGAGVPVLPSLSAACAALRGAAPPRAGERNGRALTDADTGAGATRPAAPGAPGGVVPAADAVSSLRFVEAAGVAVPPWDVATDVAGAVRTGAGLGWPVVLKANVAAEAHKAASDAVRLDVDERTAPDVAAALLELAPELIVARQLRGGPELIAGVRRDPSFGLVVVAGLGGGHVELIGRTVTLPASATVDALAERLTAGVFGRAGPRYRHLPGPLARTAATLAGLARRYDLNLVECNPLVEVDNALIALDARVIT